MKYKLIPLQMSKIAILKGGAEKRTNLHNFVKQSFDYVL